MSILRNMAIKHKLISIIMVTCIVALLLAGIAFVVWEGIAFRQQMVRNLSAYAEIITENCKAALAFNDAKDAKETLGSLHVESSIVFGCIYDSGGKVFATYYRDYAETSVHPSVFRESGYSIEGGLLTVFKPIVLDGEKIGTVCVRSDLGPMYAMLRRDISIIIFVVLAACLTAYIVSSRLQGIISEPILSLAEVARGVSEQKDYSTRALKQTNDEIGSLIDAFNEMLEQIQERDSALVGAKEELEVRVKERTAELTTANEQLTQEITVREKVEEQLRKAEEKYRTQFEGALDAIFVADAQTGILVDCNPAVTTLVGWEKSELLGKHQRILHPPELIEGEFSDTFMKHLELEEEQGQTLETQVITKEGQIKEVAIKASLIEVRGKKLLQGIFRDITVRKKAEQRQNQLLEQLEKVNQELKDFAYIISHDLKAPLRGIKTLVDWIMSDYADKLDENGKEQMNLLVSRVDRMHGLIEGVLAYSRAGRVKEKHTKVRLDKLVPGIVDMIAAPENIEITIENELPVVEYGQTQITQLFQNLLSNAVKYMDKPEGRIQISCIEEGDFWKFSVSDNGPGIEEKHFEKIFKIFQTLVPRDTFESTGVGLTVVKKIVELNGGEVWVESKVGEGSTFFFTLPKSSAREEVQVAVETVAD